VILLKDYLKTFEQYSICIPRIITTNNK